MLASVVGEEIGVGQLHKLGMVPRVASSNPVRDDLWNCSVVQSVRFIEGAAREPGEKNDRSDNTNDRRSNLPDLEPSGQRVDSLHADRRPIDIARSTSLLFQEVAVSIELDEKIS